MALTNGHDDGPTFDVGPSSSVSAHVLREVDVDNRTATCAVCGPTDIRVHRRTCRPNPWISCGGYQREASIRRAMRRRGGPPRQAGTEIVGNYIPHAVRAMVTNTVCAACGDAPAAGKSLHLDHNHDTGAVRENLCQSCNLAIGFLKDDPARAMAIVEYLIKHGAPRP